MTFLVHFQNGAKRRHSNFRFYEENAIGKGDTPFWQNGLLANVKRGGAGGSRYELEKQPHSTTTLAETNNSDMLGFKN